MPAKPPLFRPAGWQPPKPWARSRFAPDQRKRGRAGQRDRAQVLTEEPLCCNCLEAGKTVASDEVDHIVPLSEGGTDVRANKQGLCTPCHKAKSAAERAAFRRLR